MNHFTLHIADYLRDTQQLSQGQHGALMLLLNWYYAREKPLPNDLTVLCRVASAYSPEEQANLRFVLNYYFTLEADHCWHQKRCDKEISAFQAAA